MVKYHCSSKVENEITIFTKIKIYYVISNKTLIHPIVNCNIIMQKMVDLKIIYKYKWIEILIIFSYSYI